MYHADDESTSAKYMHLFDNKIWAHIRPIKSTDRLRSTSPQRIKKKTEVKPNKKKEKDTPKNKVGILIKNKRFSLTSFLIPICITGERKDYKLLYCICALKNALKILSTTLRKEGFAQLYMVGMKSAVDWEKIKTNRTTFTDIITAFLVKSGAVCMIAADRKEVFTKINDRDAPFIVTVASTDIHLPCQENLCVGTSWLIFRRPERSRDVLFDREVYNCGRRAIHAGVLVNGCSTTITVGFKMLDGIHHFVFDNRYGDFILLQDHCFLRHSGNMICLNEGLLYKFTKKVQDWLLKKKLTEGSYHSRYTGGWVSDGYKILRSGGLLLSPEDSENNEGRIKLLYKALPMAFLIKKAGGKATNGRIPISMLKKPRALYTNLVLGTIDDVDSFMEIQKKAPLSDKFIKKYEDTDSDDTSTDFE